MCDSIFGVLWAVRQNLLMDAGARRRNHQSTPLRCTLRIQGREACMRGGHDPRSLTMTFSYSRRDIVVAACSAGLVVLAQPGIAAPISFKVDLRGAQQVPPVQTNATGKADLTYDPASRVLTWYVTYKGLSGPATMAHFHGPAMQGKNGPPVIWLSEK